MYWDCFGRSPPIRRNGLSGCEREVRQRYVDLKRPLCRRSRIISSPSQGSEILRRGTSWVNGGVSEARLEIYSAGKQQPTEVRFERGTPVGGRRIAIEGIAADRRLRKGRHADRRQNDCKKACALVHGVPYLFTYL